MRSLIVPVVHEFFMSWIDWGFDGVGLEGLDLTDRGWPPDACDDMLDAVSTAELRERGDASSCWIELGASVRQYLVRLPVLFHRFFQ